VQADYPVPRPSSSDDGSSGNVLRLVRFSTVGRGPSHGSFLGGILREPQRRRDLLKPAAPCARDIDPDWTGDGTRGRHVERARVADASDAQTTVRWTLRLLALRHQALTYEVAAIDQAIAPLFEQHAARLLELPGVGPEVAGALLVVAGDNPQRLHSEASFAALCGVTPLPASSGKTIRHRLNRGGDRQANCALWRIAMSRLSFDKRTQLYARRRTTEGLSKREILRCLKRYIAREVFTALPMSSTLDMA
jgi:transposase